MCAALFKLNSEVVGFSAEGVVQPHEFCSLERHDNYSTRLFLLVQQFSKEMIKRAVVFALLCNSLLTLLKPCSVELQ